MMVDDESPSSEVMCLNCNSLGCPNKELVMVCIRMRRRCNIFKFFILIDGFFNNECTLTREMSL